MDIQIKSGTDSRFPSVRVFILGQPALDETRRVGMDLSLPENQSLAPLDASKLTEREIVVVFKNGETPDEQMLIVRRAVYDYLHPTQSPDKVPVSQEILNLSSLPDGIPPETQPIPEVTP